MIVFGGRKYAYYLGPPYIKCELYMCIRGDIRSPDVNNDCIIDSKDISLVC